MPPAAPAMDCAPYVEVESAPSAVTVAATARSWAWTVSVAGTVALFVTLARVSATAAPIVAVPDPAPDPSALDALSVLADDASDTIVPAVIEETSEVTTVRATTVESVIAIAAATLTDPLELDASGACAVPAPSPPLAEAVLPALVRSPSASWFTPLPDAPPGLDASVESLSFCGAPAAEASAVDEASEMLEAASETPPVAVVLRASVEVTVWFAMVSARPTPIAALVASRVAEDAFVPAVAFWVAACARLPASERMPVPTRVVVVTLERVIATAGASATLPPFAPIRASAVAESVAVAVSVRLRAPVSETPSPISAFVTSVMSARATDAPSPS